MKLRHIPSFLVLAGLLCACTLDELTDSAQSSVGQLLVLTVDFPPATRATVDNYWDEGDTVYVQIMDNYDGNNADWTDVPILKYTVDADGRRLNLQSEPNLPVWGVNETQKLIRAWYSGKVALWQNSSFVPYYITNLNNPVTWYVSEYQHFNSYGNAGMPPYEGSDFVFAQTIAKPDQRDVPLTFYHQVAKVMINVKNDLPGSNRIDDASIANFSYLSGTFTPPELGNNHGSWIPTGYRSGHIGMKTFSAADVLVDFGDGKAVTPNARYGCLVIPQPTEVDNRYIQFYVDVKGDFEEYFYCTLTQSDNWNPGYIYTYNLTLKPSGLKLSSIDVGIGWDTTGATGSGEAVL